MHIIANKVNQVFLTLLRDMVTNPRRHARLHLPGCLRRVSTVEHLCQHLYPQLLFDEAATVHNSLADRAIHAFGNDTVNDFNNGLLETMPGVEHRFEAVNHVNVPEDNPAAEPFAVEYCRVSL